MTLTIAHPHMIHDSVFTLNKINRSILSFQTKYDDGNGGTIIVMRSISGFNDSKEEVLMKENEHNNSDANLDFAHDVIDANAYPQGNSAANDNGIDLNNALESNIIKRKNNLEVSATPEGVYF